MKRLGILIAILFGSSATHASAGLDAGLGFWPTAGTQGVVVAQQAPPAPPAPPRPPAPPSGGMNIHIHDGKVDISGVDGVVDNAIDTARQSIEHAPLAPDVKKKLLEKLDKTRQITKKRMANLKGMTAEQVSDEMEKMGEEIGNEMEEFGNEMEKWGEKMGASFGDQHKDKSKHRHDDDDDDDDTAAVPMAPGVDVDTDDSDLKDAIKDLGDLALKPAQRDAITKLRKDSDRTVADAKRQLDQLAGKLHDSLGNKSVTDAEVARYVDQISAQEAVIRKARLIAWVNARRVLDDAQRKRVEDAAKKK